MTSPPEDTDVADPSLQDVGLAVKRLQWRHHRTANERLAELGVSLVQWDVLRHLGRHPDASLHALAELTFQTDQSMGSLAARMVERGLIERVPGPGRAIRHRLTGRGEEARRAGAEIFDGVLSETLGGLSPAELADLHRLLLHALA
ncbi:MarR family transcriptional regulator [Actinomadura darangshiensis]|uniref:MarR family transcriptional regulator n=1 Tax=Actinomadura darangshiensis TaxID=705336 RepID=A0A4R5B0P8_9ACTN|nr:MarR family winged helix-turn-helix transcriptional regulator [Actinomadura darangshiensis]TDD79548.1 MarR family transcriptional regulator [Actinomadura darangshiensis]